MLKRLSQPSGLFVSVEDVKAHTVVDFDEDDALIETYIRAATRLAEDRTGRVLLPTEFEWLADKWDDATIPAFPLREVTEVAYLNADDVEQTLSGSDWYPIETDRGFSVRYISGFLSPTLSSRPQSVRVRFIAGYNEPGASGDDPALEPDELDRIIVMALVAHWYSNREAVSPTAMEEVPMHAESMIAMRRIYR